MRGRVSAELARASLLSRKGRMGRGAGGPVRGAHARGGSPWLCLPPGLPCSLRAHELLLYLTHAFPHLLGGGQALGFGNKTTM